MNVSPVDTVSLELWCQEKQEKKNKERKNVNP